MAKKDFRQDTEDIFGLDQPPVKRQPAKAEAKATEAKPAKAELPKPQAAKHVPVKKEATHAPAEKLTHAAPNEKLTLKSYYLTPRLYKALKLRSAMSDRPEDKDLSAIVRAALSEYLKDELKLV